MKYIGHFKNINEISYKVVIDTGGTGETEVLMGTEPFIVSYEGESTIYKPLKLSAASLRVVSNNYLFDIYSAEAQGTKIQLFKNDSQLEWSGYVEPNLYSQDFNQETEVIEINATDALSTLEYFKYEPVIEGKKGFVQFGSILLKALQKASGDYTKLYISMSTQRSDYNPLSPECILDKLYISEQNFFDEDGNPMTYKEVLEEMMKYFGYTLIAYKDTVYVIDYDAIKTGYNKFFAYQTIDNFLNHTTQVITLSNNKIITNLDFTESGSTITLDEVFNKVRIECSTYNIDDVLLDVWKDEWLTNKRGAWNETMFTGVDEKFQYHRYYDHKYYESFYYSKDGLWTPITFENQFGFYDTVNNIGATLIRFFTPPKNGTSGSTGYLESLEFGEYLVMHRYLLSGTIDVPRLPVFKTKADSIPELNLSDKCYIVFKGNALWNNRTDNGAMIINEEYKASGDSYISSWLKLWARLRIGTKYFNGTGWTTTPTDFQLPFFNDQESTDHYINHWFPILNTVSYGFGIDETGFCAMINPEDQIKGDVEFILYTPEYINTDIDTGSVWLKDFGIKICKPNIDEESETDTLYENIINESYVKEGVEMSTKIVTQTTKAMAFSSPFFLNGTFLYTLKNIPLNVTQTPEKTIIQRYVNQYSTPSKILDISIKNDITPYTSLTMGILTGTFIVDTMEIDYFYDKNKVKLVEKK